MLVLSLVVGSSRDFVLQANNSDGTPAANLFTGGDTITSRVWRGDDQSTLLSPTTTWVSATAGTFMVTLNDADTATFEVGQYRIQSLASAGGRTTIILDAFLALDPAPGIAAVRPVYCTFADMTKLAPQVTNLQTPDDLEGFLDQRADAREWLNQIVLNNYRGAGMGLYEQHSWAAFSFSSGGPRRSLVPSRFLQDALYGIGQFAGLTSGGVPSSGMYSTTPAAFMPMVNTNGALLIRPPVRKATAYKAISEVYLGQLGKGGDYSSYGAMYRNAADAEVMNLRVELDINQDGMAEISVPLSTSNVFYT